MTEMTEEEFQQFKVDFREFMRLQIIELRTNMPTPDGSEYSRKKMAEELGIKENTYAGYETEGKPRNNFPMALLSRFCEITGYDPWTVLTKQGAALAPGKRKLR